MADIFNTLKGYTDIQKRDTWSLTGQNYITSTSTVYTKGTLYKINFPTSVIHGGLVLALDTFSSSTLLTWQTIEIIDATAGYISFSQHVINPYFSLILTPAKVTAISAIPVNTSFIPYEIPAYSVVVPDDELDRILLEVGVPFVELEELEFTKEQILSLMIKPALDLYFKWFPKIKSQVYPMSSISFDVPVPVGAYDAHRVFVIQGNPATVPTNGPANPLLRYFDEGIFSMMNGLTKRSKSQIGRTMGNNYATMSANRAVLQGMTNYMQRIFFKTEKDDLGVKHVTGYSLKMGYLQIEWAYSSNNWSDVEFRLIQDVRELAAAKVLRAVGQLRSQVKSDIPGTIDYDAFVSRASDLEDKIIGKWEEWTKVAIVRS
jgi:hypothetical protein